MNCLTCGHRFKVGDWPFHDVSTPGDPHGRPHGMHDFHAYMDENLGPEPILVTSLAQRKRLMREQNLDYAPRTNKKGREI